MREISTVLSGLSYLECPRWHEDRIRVSDSSTRRVWASFGDLVSDGGRTTALGQLSSAPDGCGLRSRRLDVPHAGRP